MSPHRRLPLEAEKVARHRAELVAQAEELEGVALEVHRALHQATDAFVAVRELLVSGGRLSDLEAMVDPIQLRSNLAESLNQLERARHRAQCLMFRLLAAEGRSLSDIAQAWGISRQLVSRLVNEDLSAP